MGNKLDWTKARIYHYDPDFNFQERTPAQKRADRKWIRKQRKKQKQLEAIKAGKRPSGAQQRKRKRRKRDGEFVEKISGVSVDNAEARWD